jgi:hypothetical protein
MQSVTIEPILLGHYAECHYVDCRYGKCHEAVGRNLLKKVTEL